MKIHLICDSNWSTGSIAKDLVACLPDKDLRLHHWGDHREFPDDELLIGFTLTTCARWPNTRGRNAIHVCCGPLELSLPEVRDYIDTRPPLFFGGVSQECTRALPGVYGALLPGSARAGRFERRKRPGRRIAGFIGHPQTQNVQVSGPAKRPEWLLEICARYNLTPKFSNADYTYETMQDFYDGVDYLFCTSTSEGGPLGPFEAALCGVPAISTKVGFWGESDMGGYFSSVDDSAIDVALTNAAELADQQFDKMKLVCAESTANLWRTAIDFVAEGIKCR